MPRRVLFLCTGNYYRSRFAEILFNQMARKSALNWVAFSRALALDKGSGNVGPISRHTREACAKRDLIIPEPIDFPRAATVEDFAADRVIALKEIEHRAYIEKSFQQWSEQIEYWHVDDLDAAAPEQACAEIERHVVELVRSLRNP